MSYRYPIVLLPVRYCAYYGLFSENRYPIFAINNCLLYFGVQYCRSASETYFEERIWNVENLDCYNKLCGTPHRYDLRRNENMTPDLIYFQEGRATGQLLRCPVCYDDFLRAEKVSCAVGHHFCKVTTTLPFRYFIVILDTDLVAWYSNLAVVSTIFQRSSLVSYEIIKSIRVL
jgi:hypothetical protein